MQELPGVDRETFDVLPLPFGKERVERERALARAARPGDDDQAVAGDVEIDVLQVVDAGARMRITSGAAAPLRPGINEASIRFGTALSVMANGIVSNL